MSEEASESGSTIPSDVGSRAIRREKRFLLVTCLVVAAVVAMALLGILGVSTDVAAAQGGPFRVEVSHATVTRPGLATPFAVTVSTRDGEALPSPLTLRLDTAYLDIFDEHGMTPTPSSTYNTGEWTYWEFEVPEGRETLVVELDVRLEPSVQWRQKGSVAVESGEDAVVEVPYTTWVVP